VKSISFSDQQVTFANGETHSFVEGEHHHFADKCKGVTFLRKSNMWKAQIRENGKKKNLGQFTYEVEAGGAFDRRLRLHMETGQAPIDSVTNFPPHLLLAALRDPLAAGV